MIIGIKLWFILLMTIFSLIGCDSYEIKGSADRQGIGDVKLLTFSSDDTQLLTNARPFLVSAVTPLKSALDALGRHLSDTYFSRTYSNEKTGISFEIAGIHEVPAGPRSVKIAVINMIDKENFAMQYFFQGSTGARITFHMLSVTFTQPHLSVPIVDGLIILYNGKMLPEMDHINLSGILTPGAVRNVAIKAIHNTRTEEAGLKMQTERVS